jgi:hypothetical protein
MRLSQIIIEMILKEPLVTINAEEQMIITRIIDHRDLELILTNLITQEIIMSLIYSHIKIILGARKPSILIN